MFFFLCVCFSFHHALVLDLVTLNDHDTIYYHSSSYKTAVASDWLAGSIPRGPHSPTNKNASGTQTSEVVMIWNVLPRHVLSAVVCSTINCQPEKGRGKKKQWDD